MTDLQKTADTYSRLRWLGIALFVVGVGLLVPTLIFVVRDGLPARRLVLTVLSCGLSLGAFGAANDTALHAMNLSRGLGQLSPEHAGEWAHEAAARGKRLRELHASPKTAKVLPIVVILLQGWLVSHLPGILGAAPGG